MTTFTATLLSKTTNADGRIACDVAFTGDGLTVKRTYTFDSSSTLEQMRQVVARDATNIGATIDLFSAINPGPINLTPPAPPTPTTADTWFANYTILIRALAGVRSGIIDANNADLLALQASLKAGFLTAYLSDPRFVIA